MAQVGYINIKEIPGDANRTGFKKDSTLLYSLNFNVENPWDRDHAAMAGKRHWDVVEAELGVDKGIYLYYQNMIDKDAKPDYKPLAVEFGLFRQNQKELGLIGAGDSKPYLVVQLTDARVVGVKFDMGSRDEKLGTDRLKIRFSFRQIAVVWGDGNKTATDAWDAK